MECLDLSLKIGRGKILNPARDSYLSPDVVLISNKCRISKSFLKSVEKMNGKVLKTKAK